MKKFIFIIAVTLMLVTTGSVHAQEILPKQKLIATIDAAIKKVDGNKSAVAKLNAQKLLVRKAKTKADIAKIARKSQAIYHQAKIEALRAGRSLQSFRKGV